MARHFALIPAAGVGSRMAADLPKQYLPLAGRPMLLHSIAAFVASPAIEHVFVVVSADDGYIDSLDLPVGRVTVLKVGGATRKDSVQQGLQALRAQAGDEDWVLVHDAARPGFSPALLQRLLAALDEDEVGGLLALPVVDTVKKAGPDARAASTVSREGLWAAQTPQMFRIGLLQRALAAATDVTDEASAVEALGLAPKLVEGSLANLKVTRPEDLRLAELLMEISV
jgi:2-C-methyl-D-erythritol 4-phosphate cytidylyltransferase